MTFPPTAEQQIILDLFETGENLAIEAGAGAGKTSALILCAKSTTRRGRYLAFNRPIVEEARSQFPSNVTCSTAHSLAYQAIGKPFSDRLRNSTRMKSWDIAKILRLDPIRVTTFADEQKTLSPGFLAGVVMNATRKFCMTADLEPTYRHIPMIPGLDAPPSPERPTSYAVNNSIARALEPALKRAWKDLSLYEGALPAYQRHDIYLKLYQLSNPRIETEFILFDEAQDANPVMLAIVAAQTHAQLVFVGDSQQQIYSFTGAVNALGRVREMDGNVAFLTQSFRFGPAVADTANLVLDSLNAELRLTGFDKIPSVVEPVEAPRAILTRTNAEALRNVLAAIENGLKPFLVGGGGEIASFCRAALNLQDGRRVEHPELACFATWAEVREYVEQDEQGGDLRLMVKLIDEFTAQVILDALDQTATESRADVIVSTAHKSKGREWDSVALGADFPEPDKMGDEEKRLLYVAVTRARLQLDITAVAFFNPVAAPPATGAEVAA